MTLTPEQMDAGLRLHRLEAIKPSQLADAFRAGAKWGYRQRQINAGGGGIHICARHDKDIVADPQVGCPKCNVERMPPAAGTCHPMGDCSIDCR